MKSMNVSDLYVFGDKNVQVPAHLNFGNYMLDSLRSSQDEVALVRADTGDKTTFKEFTQYAVDLAVALLKLGVQKGDVIALGIEKGNNYLPAAIGIILSGAIFTPLEMASGRAILKHKLHITKPKYIIVSKSFCEKHGETLSGINHAHTYLTLENDTNWAVPVKQLRLEKSDVKYFEPVSVKGQTDTAIILYSSGTTGMPKGVKLSHLNCILNSMPDEYTDESLQISFIFGEWYHNYDIFMTFKFLLLGRTTVYNGDIDLEEIIRGLSEYKVNIAFLTPSVVSGFTKTDVLENYNMDNLLVIYCRSSPLHTKTIENIKRRLPNVKELLQGYGMTEAGELTSENWSTKGPKIGSVGMTSPGLTMKVVDIVTREPLGPNQHGEICVRGPNLMIGYVDVDPSQYLDKDGFLMTGDLGYFDDDKYFFIVARLKEIIVYDGFKIAPLELETLLLQHPSVLDAGVVGKKVNDDREEPTAFVVKKPDSNVTEKELQEFVAAEVNDFMQLKGGVKFIPQIPRNQRGKILRKNLKDMIDVIV